jgi:hypothetical protein
LLESASHSEIKDEPIQKFSKNFQNNFESFHTINHPKSQDPNAAARIGKLPPVVPQGRMRWPVRASCAHNNSTLRTSAI